jgi:hypothetical protein
MMGPTARAWATAAFAVCIVSGCSRSTCDYPNGGCADGQVCAFVERATARCIPYAEDDLELAPPFATGHELWCSQRGRSAIGRTHSFQADLFAVDLASDLPGDVQVVTPVAGTAYVFDGCEERDATAGARNNSRCGLGYGNHVKVWDGTNIYLFAHLARVAVGPGRLAKDQVIGTMGCSGAAGHRHVHVSVTRPRSSDDPEAILSTPGWSGSIPVRFRLATHHPVTREVSVEWSDRLPCDDRRDRAAVLRR